MNPSVHKFGGVELANAAAIQHAVKIDATRRTRGAVVVVSAMGGVTDALLEVADLAKARKRAAAQRAIASLRARHAATANELTSDAKLLRAVVERIEHELDELEELARRIAAAPSRLDAATTDRIVARGERLAAHLMTAALSASDVRAQYVDATRIIHASGSHGNAAPVFARTARAIRQTLIPLMRRDVTPVVPGFIARGPRGAIMTLGRGGSDLTATLLARALGASTVTLWKDVP